ncbi:MAG: class I SAM-dependent methyltransferase [Pseudomonadota bacterium]
MKTPKLFKAIETLHGDAPWGHVLDAGTGAHSLTWVQSLPTDRWTAVTAQRLFVEEARSALPSTPRKQDRIVFGNWANGELLVGETFDTIILDYLIGAVDAFAPYFQESLMSLLASRLTGSLYVIGLEPYVPLVEQDEVGQFIGDLGRMRDACQLLARDRPYREFPSTWVQAQLLRAGLRVSGAKYFPIRYGRKFLENQLSICANRVDTFADPELARAMSNRIFAMREQGNALIDQHGSLRYGKNYVLRATRVP